MKVKAKFGVKEPYLTQLVEGQKTHEGRLAKSFFTQIQIGDNILLNGTYYFKVVSISRYPDFEAMLTDLGYKKFIPSASDINQAVGEYYRFYKPDDEKKFGVISLGLKFIS
jgi:ASC-1-like (ASCH) protein